MRSRSLCLALGGGANYTAYDVRLSRVGDLAVPMMTKVSVIFVERPCFPIRDFEELEQYEGNVFASFINRFVGALAFAEGLLRACRGSQVAAGVAGRAVVDLPEHDAGIAMEGEDVSALLLQLDAQVNENFGSVKRRLGTLEAGAHSPGGGAAAGPLAAGTPSDPEGSAQLIAAWLPRRAVDVEGDVRGGGWVGSSEAYAVLGLLGSLRLGGLQRERLHMS